MTAVDPSSLAGELIWLVLATALLLPVTILATVQRLRGRPVSSPWLVLGPLCTALLPTLLGGLLLVGWDTKGPDALRLAVTSFGTLRLGAWLTTVPALLLGAVAVVILAFREEPPRRWRRVGAAAAVVGGTALVVVGVGVHQGDVLFAGLRGSAYVVTGLVMALGFVGERPAASGALFPMLVAVGEASHRGMVTLLVLLQVPQLEADLWAEGVSRFYAAVHTTQLAGGAAVALACTMAALGGWWSREHGVAEAAAAAMGIVGALLIIALADIGAARLVSLQVLCS